MEEIKIIQDLQDRFDLTKVQATVIYYELQNHFEKKENEKS